MKLDLRRWVEISNMNYQNSKIYKLSHPSCKKVYIGSTVRPLEMRLKDHRIKYNNWKRNPENNSFTSSFLLFDYGLDDVTIELITLFPCDSQKTLRRKEGEYIQQCDCVNLVIPGRNDHEWYMANRDRILEMRKEYNITNRESIKKKNSEYYQRNKERFYEKRKEYVEQHKEEIKQYMKKYRDENADKIKAHKSSKVLCECGIESTRSHLRRHQRTKTHQDRMALLTVNTE